MAALFDTSGEWDGAPPFCPPCSYASVLFADQELRNVIDKLAQFVARNGPEFEKMTMEKQKDNPKFSFLFGGDFFSYYKCKLTLEQQQRTYRPSMQSASSLQCVAEAIVIVLQLHSGVSMSEAVRWGVSSAPSLSPVEKLSLKLRF